MTHHHIRSTDPAGVMTTACGLTGIAAMGGGIDIAGKWSNLSRSKTPNAASCQECAAALVKAMPARLKPPTIYSKLKERLGREPSNRELIKAAKDTEAELDSILAGRRHQSRLRHMADLHAHKTYGVPMPTAKKRKKL